MTGDDQRLQSAFSDLLGTPPVHADPLDGVHRRVGRMRRRRNVVATAAVSVTAVGAAAAIYAVTRPSPPVAPAHQPPATTEVVVINPQLSLDVDVAPTVAVGAEETVTVVLTGTGEPADRYGFRVAWGDGGIERIFGSDNCHTGPATSLHVTRVFAHHYLRSGTERIVVEITRCGVVQARTIVPRISVTPEH